VLQQGDHHDTGSNRLTDVPANEKRRRRQSAAFRFIPRVFEGLGSARRSISVRAARTGQHWYSSAEIRTWRPDGSITQQRGRTLFGGFSFGAWRYGASQRFTRTKTVAMTCGPSSMIWLGSAMACQSWPTASLSASCWAAFGGHSASGSASRQVAGVFQFCSDCAGGEVEPQGRS